MTLNRRADTRQRLAAALGIETEIRKGRAGVSRNLSTTGVLFHSASRFTLGERVQITVRSPATGEHHEIVGTVVRVAFDLPNPSLPHITAVEFAEPQDLAP